MCYQQEDSTTKEGIILLYISCVRLHLAWSILSQAHQCKMNADKFLLAQLGSIEQL